MDLGPSRSNRKLSRPGTVFPWCEARHGQVHSHLKKILSNEVEWVLIFHPKKIKGCFSYLHFKWEWGVASAPRYVCFLLPACVGSLMTPKKKKKKILILIILGYYQEENFPMVTFHGRQCFLQYMSFKWGFIHVPGLIGLICLSFYESNLDMAGPGSWYFSFLVIPNSCSIIHTIGSVRYATLGTSFYMMNHTHWLKACWWYLICLKWALTGICE